MKGSRIRIMYLKNSNIYHFALSMWPSILIIMVYVAFKSKILLFLSKSLFEEEYDIENIHLSMTRNSLFTAERLFQFSIENPSQSKWRLARYFKTYLKVNLTYIWIVEVCHKFWLHHNFSHSYPEVKTEARTPWTVDCVNILHRTGPGGGEIGACPPVLGMGQIKWCFTIFYLPPSYWYRLKS